MHALLHPSASLGLPPVLLLANAAIAFSLNCVALFLLQIIGGVAQSLAGVVKDIALIAGSVLFFGNVVSLVQIFGEHCPVRLVIALADFAPAQATF